MKIRVQIAAFPGTDQERVELLAAIRRNCACRLVRGATEAIGFVEEPCASHALLADAMRLKLLVFERRWRRAHAT